jgi:hypothetical protein
MKSIERISWPFVSSVAAGRSSSGTQSHVEPGTDWCHALSKRYRRRQKQENTVFGNGAAWAACTCATRLCVVLRSCASWPVVSSEMAGYR